MGERILYWTSRFWPHIGGVEVLGLHLIPALQARGMAVQVITSHSDRPLPNEAEINGIPIGRFHFLTSLTRRDLPQMAQARRSLAELKRAFRPDLTHIHLTGPEPFFHWQTQPAHPTPTLVTIHAIPNELHAQNSLLVDTLRRADWVTTVSAVMLDKLRQLAPEIAERSSVIYNGVTPPAESATRLSMEPPVFLCLGRLVDWKGFDVALAAFARLLPDFPQARLVIAGNGPARAGLEAQARALGIAAAVDFLGWVQPEDVPGRINQCSAVLIPSRQDENLPIVALQAAQMARPVIASRVSGLPEIVQDHVTGLLVEPDQPEALAAAMAYLLQHKPEARRLGLANQAFAGQHFNLDQCAAAYADLYRRLIAAAAHRETDDK
jgi:glycogen(starch) synthase